MLSILTRNQYGGRRKGCGDTKPPAWLGQTSIHRIGDQYSKNRDHRHNNGRVTGGCLCDSDAKQGRPYRIGGVPTIVRITVQ